MIRVKATEDGTYTVYRDRTVLVTGLTREQADAFAQSSKAVRDYRIQS
ncbi:hypothetical protein [Methylobacterium sp. A54F]